MMGRAVILVLLALGGRAALSAQEASKVPKGPADKVDQAIARGTAYLLSVQDKDGAIVDRPQNHTSMTSLAVMALAAVGHQPTDETKEGAVMKKALAYVLRPDRQDEKGYSGYYGGRDGSRMYGHGITTLMLSEMLGMGVDAQQDQTLRDRCRKAVDLILRAQSLRKDKRHQGGWRYQPDSPDADLSVTVWQVMALRSARNAGIEVPKEAIASAVEYLKRCYYSPKRAADGTPENLKSACAYEPNRGPEYAMAAAGLLALQVCGEYEALEVKGSADWLKERKLDYGAEWFFYGTYYYAQGMYQRGGEHAAHARKAVEELLLPHQEADGSWKGRHGQEAHVGKVYSTSLAMLSLAVKYHYLPIYQR
jgi:hypothetical protein